MLIRSFLVRSLCRRCVWFLDYFCGSVVKYKVSLYVCVQYVVEWSKYVIRHFVCLYHNPHFPHFTKAMKLNEPKVSLVFVVYNSTDVSHIHMCAMRWAGCRWVDLLDRFTYLFVRLHLFCLFFMFLFGPICHHFVGILFFFAITQFSITNCPLLSHIYCFCCCLSFLLVLS